MTTLRNILFDNIHAYVNYNNRQCTLIVMHPETWIKLFKEIKNLNTLEIKDYTDLKFSGIKVLRSIDVEENQFELR